MFEESPNSKKVWDYFNNRYGQLIAPVGLAKVCSVVSAKMREYPTFNVFNVAPTRQFKSITSADIKKIFSNKYYLWLGSDFTVHSIKEQYEKELNKRCLLINDGTLLFASKQKRTKDRLINALSELISEGFYKYAERIEQWTLTGRVSIIMNMTLESYQRYKNVLLGSTFLERFLTLFYMMPFREQKAFVMEKSQRLDIKFEKITKKIKKNVKINGFLHVLTQKSRDFSILSGKSFLGTHDQIVSLAKSHACLNEREEICQDEIDFLDCLQNYMKNPMSPNDSAIIRFRTEGRTYEDICLLLNKDPKKYIPYVSRVISKAKERGLTF